MHLIQGQIGLPKMLKEELEANVSRFVISPLPQGYGTTLGNTLRRVLLSSLPGAAVTGIKVKGVNYEYATIQGAKDSVLDILLNLKQLKLSKSDIEPSFITLKANKAGQVFASAIECPTEVKILNPELLITTIEKGSDLEIKIKVEKGVGYLTSNEIKDQNTEIDWIWTDAFFSPVKKVRFETDHTRVGQQTNLDKLILDVETNGSITPEDAIKFASNLMQSYFGYFNSDSAMIEENFMSDPEKIQEQKVADAEVQTAKETYTPIEILGLSPRTLNACINGEIGSIEQLTKCSETKLSNLRGFGKKALTEVKDALASRGLSLADE
ncbi:DNA-directed RNA polymerase subunit alpha [bacterium]|jgi:DNA-directed RNA polymerase subunit alpha|nr:DNA-directed RNA polymerase subunit alpha [bacterium]